MRVKRIEFVDLIAVKGTDLYESNLCLLLQDDAGHNSRNTYLCCRVEKRPQDGHAALARRLVEDAHRQLTWMPEFRTGQERLIFDTTGATALAA